MQYLMSKCLHPSKAFTRSLAKSVLYPISPKLLSDNKSQHCRAFYCGIIHKSYANKILKETKLSRHHLTPELQLYLITNRCRLWTARPEDSPFPDPFWAFYWPGGQAVTRYILDNPSLVKGKSVLDFGCGCGASGLAALMSKAKQVTFNDIDKVSIEAVRLNGKSNNITVTETSIENLIGSDCKNYEVLLVGDMLYDTEFANDVFSWLKELSRRNILVLIGDPGRLALKSSPLKSSLKLLTEYELCPNTILENKGHAQAYVWSFM